MKRLKLPVVLFVVLLSFSCFLGLFRPVFAADEAGARALITEARGLVVSCYDAAADADKAGANVSGLLVVLNSASDLLSRADLAFLKRDFDSAADFASRSRNTLNGFVDDAAALRENAAAKESWDLVVNVAGSILGTAAVFVISFVVWGELKRKYGYGGNGSDGS